MRNSNTLIIKSIESALTDRILPELQSASGAQAAKIALTLLGILRNREKLDLVDGARTQYEDLLARMRNVIACHAASNGANESPDPLEFLVEDVYDASHEQLFRTQALLTQCARRLIKIRDELDAKARKEINLLLDEMGQIELTITNRFLTDLQQPQDQDAQTQTPIEINAGTLRHYLEARFPERQGLAVSDVGGAGFSMGKQVHFFEVTDAAGQHDALVMRQEKPTLVYEGLDSTRIRHEYPLMKCASALGLPIPELLWLDTSGALGPDFMVMRKAEGKQMGEVFKAYRPLSEDIIMQIAEIMAKLHGAGLEPFQSYLQATGRENILGMSASAATAFRISDWERFCNDGQDFPNPGKLWLFDWLTRHIPDDELPAVMVHGDFGIHNLLEDQGHITACLDWEWAHPGHPIEDLAYIRPHVDQYSNWDRFIKHYTAHGGPDIRFTDNAVSFYACLSNAFFSILSSRSAFFATKGIRTDMTSLFGGNYYGYEFQRQAMEGALKFRGAADQ